MGHYKITKLLFWLIRYLFRKLLNFTVNGIPILSLIKIISWQYWDGLRYVNFARHRRLSSLKPSSRLIDHLPVEYSPAWQPFGHEGNNLVIFYVSVRVNRDYRSPISTILTNLFCFTYNHQSFLTRLLIHLTRHFSFIKNILEIIWERPSWPAEPCNVAFDYLLNYLLSIELVTKSLSYLN